MVNFTFRVSILWGFIFYITNSPCFALTLIPQKDGNYTIINDNGTKAMDISLATIELNAEKYNSQYWVSVKHMAENSVIQLAKEAGGNFR